MTNEELIVRQAIMIEELKDQCQLFKEAIGKARALMNNIGGPLNDNSLCFNFDQRNLIGKIDWFLNIGEACQ